MSSVLIMLAGVVAIVTIAIVVLLSTYTSLNLWVHEKKKEKEIEKERQKARQELFEDEEL